MSDLTDHDVLMGLSTDEYIAEMARRTDAIRAKTTEYVAVLAEWRRLLDDLVRLEPGLGAGWGLCRFCWSPTAVEAHDGSCVWLRAVRLVAPGRERPRRCPDCGAEVGDHHHADCDVAPCKTCGGQALQCFDHPHGGVHSTRWSGRWPGEVECEEFGLWAVWSRTVLINGHPSGTGELLPVEAGAQGAIHNLSALSLMAARGEVRWDGDAERWVRP